MALGFLNYNFSYTRLVNYIIKNDVNRTHFIEKITYKQLLMKSTVKFHVHFITHSIFIFKYFY